MSGNPFTALANKSGTHQQAWEGKWRSGIYCFNITSKYQQWAAGAVIGRRQDRNSPPNSTNIFARAGKRHAETCRRVLISVRWQSAMVWNDPLAHLFLFSAQ